MSRKDFSDWNGPKRKSLIRPPREHEVYRKTHPSNKKSVGLKTKCDRYRSAIVHLRWWLERRQTTTGNDWVKPWRFTGARDAVKSIRKLQAEYEKEGIWQKVRQEVLGGN